ncbi:MAG: hypothetical protein CO068_10435, partial [Flavobacteriaceae bacterium CG_4_9_14_0_8_um_filter_34_30]
KNKNGESVPIKKVRIREEMSNAQQLKESNQFVNPRNNHHVLIYKDENAAFKDDITSFWEVVERQKQNEKTYQLPKVDANATIVSMLQENDMFLLGLTDEEFEDNLNNKAFLTTFIYRVQKISKGDYFFRHHLASTLNNKDQEIRVTSMKRWTELNPIKVQITDTGKIEKV